VLQAVAINPKTRNVRTLNAYEYAHLLATKPRFTKNLELYSLVDALPLEFVPAQKGKGNEMDVPPRFKILAGYSPESHVFDNRKGQTLDRALKSGKSILLSLNLDLSYQQIDYRETNEVLQREPDAQGGYALEDWIQSHYGEYHSVSIKSVEDLIKVIRKIYEHPSKVSLNDRVRVLYRGGVLPYEMFYLGKRQEDLNILFDNLKSGKSGVAFGETRVIGFPRLFIFKPTLTTMKEEGSRGLKGAFSHVANGYYFSKLIFSKPNTESINNPDYKKLFKTIKDNKKGVYVLAAPTVTINSNQPEEERGHMHMTRWIITDIESQITAVGQFGSKPRKNAGPRMNWREGSGPSAPEPEALNI
jgi:hypothetical protein